MFADPQPGPWSVLETGDSPIVTWSFMDDPSVPSAEPPGVSHHREQRLRKVWAKEFTFRSLLTKSKSMDKMVVALCSAAWVPQLAQGRAGQTCWHGALPPQLPCYFPRALHTQAPSPAGPAGDIGWSNHLAEPLSQPQRHPCLWVCSFRGSCLTRGCPGGDTEPWGSQESLASRSF